MITVELLAKAIVDGVRCNYLAPKATEKLEMLEEFVEEMAFAVEFDIEESGKSDRRRERYVTALELFGCALDKAVNG